MTKRILVVIVGILLITCGVLSLNAPYTNINHISNINGVLMVVSGFVNIVLFAKIKDFPGSSLWTLIEGILISLLGMFIILSDGIMAAYAYLLPIAHVVWLFVSGITRFFKSFGFRNYGITSWWVMLINGISSVLLAGLLYFADHIPAFATFGILISGVFILKGIMEVILGITMEMEN